MPLEPMEQKNVAPIEYKFEPAAGVASVTYTVEFGVLNAAGQTIATKVVTFSLSSSTPTKTFNPADFGGVGLGCHRAVSVVVKQA